LLNGTSAQYRLFSAINGRTEPGLVALYDIRPGNGAGQFLQPRSPHGARQPRSFFVSDDGVARLVVRIYSAIRGRYNYDIRPLFDFYSTAVRLLMKDHQGHNDLTHRWPLTRHSRSQ